MQHIDSLPSLESPTTVAILRSKWYGEMRDGLYAKCVAELSAKGVDHAAAGIAAVVHSRRQSRLPLPTMRPA